MSPEQLREKTETSEYSSMLVKRYCESVNMSKEDQVRKYFIVRSLIYGSIIMIESGELINSNESYEIIRGAISREFDLV